MILPGATIFLSAALLFLVQVMAAKRLLPWFGGSPAVWTTCMLFFQVLLLAGYAYAHLLAARLAPRRQAVLQSTLLLVAGASLLVPWLRTGSAVLPSQDELGAGAGPPVARILELLLRRVGLPYFLLSTTSPLLQRWVSMRGRGMSTYRLYAVSNAGSLAGLLAFPFLLEPRLALSTLDHAWTGTFLLFAGASLLCAVSAARNADAVGAAGASAGPRDADSQALSGAGDRLLWILLPAVASVMFLSVTNNLCQEVAVVPFLWIVPLVVYLLTFVLTFGDRSWYRRRAYVGVAALASVGVLVTTMMGLALGLWVHLVVNTVFLFCFCMTMHGELAREQPPPRELTRYFLHVALGGAVGGLFVGLVGPALFRTFLEFHVAMAVGWTLLLYVFARDESSFFHRGDPLLTSVLVLLLALAGSSAWILLDLGPRVPWVGRHALLLACVAALLATSTLTWLGRGRAWLGSRHGPRLLVLGMACLAASFLLDEARGRTRGLVDVYRDFYGVLRVQEGSFPGNDGKRYLQLTHGRINHGVQFLDEADRRRPVGYYASSSGVALAFRHHAASSSPDPLHIGVLGLGVGTLAAYARPQDRVRFYEIHPRVVEYSTREPPLFSYLDDCRGATAVVLGDARVSLERELRTTGPQAFDILVLDAFTSDAVPVHLLTEEAFELYRQHLRDEQSILAVNISNRFLDFRDLMWSVAERFSWEPVLVESRGDPPESTASRWVLLSKSRAFLDASDVRRRAEAYVPRRELLWTDDYSDLLRLLR